ncbi:MAG: ABC transporter substrate-binding protein [Betaproteobacteria bacterium]|nr:MAG: ABC transporter substrate-binding protein [Betaproteobacteria bacterium]
MIVRIIGRFIFACVIASAFQSQAQAQALTQAQTPTTLRVITFDGGWNLPLWAAHRQGFFEAQGLAVQLSYTPTSVFLVTAVLEGRADIAFAGFDNVVAYQEGQGEAKIPDNPDLFAFIGGDGGFLAIVAAPAVKRFEDLKGKTLSVDAMTTGFAFVARELVASNALAETDVNFVRAGGTANRYRELIAGKHDATLLRTPFELLAQNRGFNLLASADALGAYQGTVGVARRSWAREHETALVGFIRAYFAATHWLYDRANREIVEAILIANVRDMTPVLAKQSYDLLLGDKGGLSRDLAPDLAGMRTVLRLRGKFGSPPKTLTDPMKYVDLSYREKALGKP